MKILIVDDHPLVRKGVVSLLSYEKDIKDILEASNVDESIRLLRSENPTLAVIDLNLGEESGLDIIEKAKKLKVETKFIILTSSINKEDYFRAKDLEVDGYVLKDAFGEDVLYAINVVLRGKRFIDPEILRYETKDKHDKYLDELTPREQDVLRELGKGLSNQEISEVLFISKYTVKKHITNIFSKLELTHRTQAALFVNNSMAM